MAVLYRNSGLNRSRFSLLYWSVKKEALMAFKTNVMRVLDKAKIEHNEYSYGDGSAVSGEEVAAMLGKPADMVFKTLVTVASSKQHYVFVIPSNAELDLKKAAAAAGEKKIEMLKSKELLPLTGYVHGGCSPIGMKKPFRTFLDLSAQKHDSILFSAGKIGYQVETAPEDLKKLVAFEYADLVSSSDR